MSSSMMAVMAIGLIFPVAPWWVFCGWVGFANIGIKLGDEAIIAGFSLGITGEAIAPSDPGFVGSPATFSHAAMGDPQRTAFRSKTDIGNAERVFGIPAAMRFLETLKVCRFGRFKPVMLPENQFSSKRRVKICQVVDYRRNLARISCCETNRDVTAGKKTRRKHETSPRTHCKQKQL